MRRSRIVPFLVLLASIGLLALGLTDQGTATGGPQLPSDQGHDVPQAGCLLVNGWDICNYADADLKDVYLRYQTYLGNPISSFDSRSQTFQFGRLTYNPANSDGEKVQFDNLGLDLLQLNGRTAAPGAELAPAVRDWLVSIQEAGIDPLVVAGRTISPPICDAHRGQCQQYLDKQVFSFPTNAVDASQVTRLALGTLLNHPQPTTPAPPTHPWLNQTRLVVLGALLGFLALGLILRQRRGATASPTTI